MATLRIILNPRSPSRSRKTCPLCHSLEVHRSTRRGLLERILKYVGVLPYRCLQCHNRFKRGWWRQ